MKWYGTLALVFFLFLLAGIVYAGANTDKIGFVIIPLAFATHDPDWNHPTTLFGYPIAMILDQDGYQTGGTIKIFGTVTKKDSESLVTITIFKPFEPNVNSTQVMMFEDDDDDDGIVKYQPFPVGAVVTSTKMMLNEDGSFSYQFKAGSGNMDVSGIYSIEMEHESNSSIREFHFQVVDDVPFFGIFVYINNLFSWITGN